MTAQQDHDAIIRTIELTKVYAAAPPRMGAVDGWRGATAGPTGAPGDNGQQRAPNRAVDRLELSVRRGEIFGLLGPNGAGKTTTIGMLTTRVLPTAGRAFVAGVDVVEEPARAKQLIGLVTQTNTLDRSLSVAENLYFHGRYFGMGRREARRETEQLLELFRLADRGGERIDALSGGMAQRLMVARSIMHRPQVLFLDEPTAGLDPQSRLSLWETIGELNAAGQTILLTTHYMEEADVLCERVAIMDHGRILALDTPEALKRSVDADTVVTVRAEGDQEAMAGALAAVEGVTSTQSSGQGVQVYTRGGRSILPRLIAATEAAGFPIDDVSVAEPTLETVFINLTGEELRE